MRSVLQGVHVPFSSLSKFPSVSIPAPEQHFYPSSMSFGVCTSSCTFIYSLYNPHVLVRRALNQLAHNQRDGPELIVLTRSGSTLKKSKFV